MAVLAKDETVSEECEFFITIDKNKPRRKNILAPIIPIPAPVVVISEPIIETPAPDITP